MAPGVSVVVPTYQRAGLLPRVVAPLLADQALGELIVVVDGSTDATMDLLERLRQDDPRICPIWQPNAGAGAARQRGVHEAVGDVVLLLDDDVVAGPGLVSGHAAEHALHPGRVVVGSMPTPPLTRRRRDDVTTVLYAKAYENACRDYLHRPGSILEGFWAGNVSMPVRLAREVGLGDPDLADLHPSEDRELGLRLRAAGVEAVFRPDLAATHLHRRSLDGFVVESRRQGRALQVLHRRHADVVPAPTGAMLAGRLPLPVRWLVTSSRRSAVAGAVVQTVLLAGVRLLGGIRCWWGQDRAVVLLQRVAQAAGALEADVRA